MKKFMLVVLFLIAPALAMADTLGALGGLALGTAIGSQVGQGNGTTAAQVILGLGMASAMSRMEDGTYGRQAVSRVVYTQPRVQGGYYNKYDDPEVEAAMARGRADRERQIRNERARHHKQMRREQMRRAYDCGYSGGC